MAAPLKFGNGLYIVSVVPHCGIQHYQYNTQWYTTILIHTYVQGWLKVIGLFFIFIFRDLYLGEIFYFRQDIGWNAPLSIYTKIDYLPRFVSV